MKQPHPNPSAKGISRCLLACLIFAPSRTGRGPESSRHYFLEEARPFLGESDPSRLEPAAARAALFEAITFIKSFHDWTNDLAPSS